MSQLQHVITIRLDEQTLARIRDRIGQGFRVKSVSQFIREGIQLRLAQTDEYTGWLVNQQRPLVGSVVVLDEKAAQTGMEALELA